MENQTKKLQGQVAIVTGASSGIGAGVAKALAEAGAIVVINYATSPEKAEAVLNEVKAKGGDGFTIKADVSKGLNGEIDFMMVHKREALELTEPVINITEAKLNQAIEKSLAQAGSQMIGARVFNANNDNPIQTIHGAVTNGKNWIFMKLEGDNLYIDTEKDYSTANLPEILGIFQVIIDSYN